MAKRPHFIQFGPPIEVVPIGDFYKARIAHEQYEWLWKTLVGPHVEKNFGLMPDTWKLMCNCYIEGLLLGYGLAQDKASKPVVPDDALLGLA